MFIPGRANGTMCRANVLARLAESVEHIAVESEGQVAFDRAAAARLIADLAANAPQRPALFGRYFELVESIRSGDADLIERDFAALLRPHAGSAGDPAIRVYGPDMAAEDRSSVRRHISLDSLGDAALVEISTADAAPRRAQVEAALARLARYVPELHGELQETVCEFILGKGVLSSTGYAFDGASSLAYWGGVLLNTAIPKTDLEVLETIAHEAGHNVLFGLSPSEFFVTNPPEERHASPLRDDPRPLDGIYHATFVLARMHYAVDRLRAAGGLESGETAEAEAMLKRSARNFSDALGVLTAHADYTEAGAAIMAECAAYMSASREPA